MSKRVLVTTFADEEDLLRTAHQFRERGLKIVDAFSPYPVHGLDEAIGLPPSRLSWVCAAFGFAGAAAMLWFQCWTSAVDWPLNVGGRPPHSPPAFIPVTFELGVLFSALGIFLGLLFAYFRFPRVHHPVFEVEAFRSASIDALWLSAEVEGAEAEQVAQELRRLGARQVSVVAEGRS